MKTKTRIIAIIAVSLILVGLAVVGSDYLELWGSTADCRDTLITLPWGGFLCIDAGTRVPIPGVEMALSDAAGFHSMTYPVKPVKPGMMRLETYFVPGFRHTRLFEFSKKITSPRITCHFQHPDYGTATVTVEKGSLVLDLSPQIIAMTPKRSQSKR